jgi:hypothetical protein
MVLPKTKEPPNAGSFWAKTLLNDQAAIAAET